MHRDRSDPDSSLAAGRPPLDCHSGVGQDFTGYAEVVQVECGDRNDVCATSNRPPSTLPTDAQVEIDNNCARAPERGAVRGYDAADDVGLFRCPQEQVLRPISECSGCTFAKLIWTIDPRGGGGGRGRER